MMLGKNRMTNEEKREDAQRFVRWAAAAAAIVAGGGIPDDCAKCGQRRSADDLDVQGRCLEDLHCPTWDVGPPAMAARLLQHLRTSRWPPATLDDIDHRCPDCCSKAAVLIRRSNRFNDFYLVYVYAGCVAEETIPGRHATFEAASQGPAAVPDHPQLIITAGGPVQGGPRRIEGPPVAGNC